MKKIKLTQEEAEICMSLLDNELETFEEWGGCNSKDGKKYCDAMRNIRAKLIVGGIYAN